MVTALRSTPNDHIAFLFSVCINLPSASLLYGHLGFHVVLTYIILGFPNSSVGKKYTCNAGDPWFDSWFGKICWRRDRLPTLVFLGFSCGSAGKKSTCNVGDLGSIPGLGRCPREGKGYPLQHSGLKNSMDCVVHGVTKSWTYSFSFHLPQYLTLHNLPEN